MPIQDNEALAALGRIIEGRRLLRDIVVGVWEEMGVAECPSVSIAADGSVLSIYCHDVTAECLAEWYPAGGHAGYSSLTLAAVAAAQELSVAKANQ